MSNYRIKTPHAAVLIWNYSDRIGVPDGGFNSTGVKKPHEVETFNRPIIISTLSCISIQTNKLKSDPVGTFNLVLAPYKNWISTVTAGSWCAILMSNEKIEEKDLKKANPKHVKMLGKIESVRCETSVDESGARKTLYYVSGVDWGHIFTSYLYIDNLIVAPNEPLLQGNPAAIAIRNMIIGADGLPKSGAVKDNLNNLLSIMGQNVGGFTAAGNDIGRLANAIYEFKIPRELADYFRFNDAKNKEKKTISINKILTLRTGSLVAQHKYDDSAEAYGFIDPFSLQGTHTIWQILLENSNPALNEMFCEFDWHNNNLQLVLYNRIRPFSYKNFKAKAAGTSQNLRSYFQLVKYHDIDPVTVISINAGTNWRDKFNFIEIKPQFQEFAVLKVWHKQKSQAYDEISFEREGFRPIIFDTKQFPVKKGATISHQHVSDGIDFSQLEKWVLLMREWYFGTHRMLNGTITIVGSSEYIGVGNNIRFPADLLNPTPNINKASRDKNKNPLILAHVESVSHSFTVQPDGAREYITTINFVRGIVVNESNEIVGSGMLDQFTAPKEGLSYEQDRNTRNTVSTSDVSDPDPQKVRGV